METTKICRTCGVEKPLDAFYREVRNSDGRTGYCRECRYPHLKAWRSKNAERPAHTEGQFFCTRCEQSLPVASFRADRSRPNGLSIWCRDCLSTAAKAFRETNIDRVRAAQADYYQRNGVTVRARMARMNRDRRLRVLSHYSGGVPSCACCGETLLEFLAIDHIDGGGNQHRKQIGVGRSLYAWLEKTGYPNGFRVLCHNCNSSLGHYGYCPHSIAAPVSSTG